MSAALSSASSSVTAPRMVRHTDIVEWLNTNRDTLKKMSQKRYKEETGILGYCKYGVEFVGEMMSNKKEEPKKDLAVEEKQKKADADATSPVMQHYASQELLKTMKWKRVTWEKEVDYESFARRLIDTDRLFTKVPAFSHMSIHLVHDKAAAPEGTTSRNTHDVHVGTLTGWFTDERSPEPIAPYVKTTAQRQPPYVIDWQGGEVRMLDSVSPQEVLTFLRTSAPRIMAIQQRMDEEQNSIVEDLDTARIRLGAMNVLKINAHDRAFWDDAARKTDSAYVDPGMVRQFLDSTFKRAFLLRWYLKGNQIRIVKSGEPYAIDQEKQEVRIPANFQDYNYLPIHGRWERLEAFFNFNRKIAMVWFFLGMMFVGDFELL